MEQHIKIISILYIIFGILGLLLAGAMLIGGAGIAASMLSSGDNDARDAAPFAGGCLTVLAVIMGLMSLPSIIAGWGLSKRKSWARILTLVLGFLSLPSVPIGTALGVYTIVIMFNDETKRLLTQ